MKQMKKRSVCLVIVLTMLVALFATGCWGRGSDTELVLTGVEDGKTYTLGQGDIKAEFNIGEAMLSKDGGAAVSYESGTPITEPGSYLLTVKTEDTTKTVRFTVKQNVPNAPVVSGVTNSQQIPFGQSVTPTFDKGTATLAKDGGEAAAYDGSPITETGRYVLVVTFESVSTTVEFEILAPVYSGEIRDEFTGELEGYIDAQDAILVVEDNNLIVKDVDDANGYCLFRKEFKGVNVTEYPFLEINVLASKNCAVTLRVGTQNPLQEGPNTSVRVEVPGNGFLDIKKFAEDNGLDMTCTDLFIQIALEGQGADSGKLSAVIDYYKSIKEIPAEVPAGEYIDNNPDSLNAWTANTAKLTVFDGTTQAIGTVTDPDNAYGKVIKRVQLNTKLYPYLVIDVADVVDGWKLEALTYENNLFVGQRVTLVNQTNKTGQIEVDLREFFGEDECVDILFELYLVGKSEEKFFTLNGLWTSDTSIIPPVIPGDPDLIEDYVDINSFTVIGGTAVYDADKDGILLSKPGSSAMTKLEKRYDLDLSLGQYLVLVFETDSYTPDAGFSVEILDDVNWDQKLVRFDAFDKVETADLGDGRTQYTCYFRVAAAIHLADGTSRDWTGAKLTNAKISIQLEYGDTDRAVCLKSLDQAAEAPGVTEPPVTDPTEPPVTDSDLIENYVDAGSFTLEGGNAAFDSEKDAVSFTKPAGVAMAKLSKRYNIDLSKGRYLVLTFEVDSYTPDAGFSIELLDDVNWDCVSKRLTEFAKVETKALANGRTQYTCYMDTVNAVHLADGTAKDWTNAVLNNAKLTVVVEYGDDARTVHLKSLSQVEEIPVTPIEDYTEAGSFTVSGGTAVYDTDKDAVIVTRPAAGGMVKLQKAYTFDFTQGKYLVLTFETQGYTPDAGFSLEMLDDVLWNQCCIRFPDFAKTETTDLGNGRTRYVCYADLTKATSLVDGSAVDWSGASAASLKLSVQIEYGDDERGVELKSLTQTAQIEE